MTKKKAKPALSQGRRKEGIVNKLESVSNYYFVGAGLAKNL